MIWIEDFDSNQFLGQHLLLFDRQICKSNLEIVQITIERLSNCAAINQIVEVLHQLRSVIVTKLGKLVLKLLPAILDCFEHVFKASCLAFLRRKVLL